MTELYEVVTLADGRWSIGAPLHGGPDRGVFRATGNPPALVTTGAPQLRPREELERELGYSIRGVTPFLAITDVRIESVPLHALVEAEPLGEPITERAPTNAAAVARELAEIVNRAHAAGHVLVGIRPELVYSDGAHCTGIAPRGEQFLASASPRDYGVPPCFEHFYSSPEVLSARPATPASDIFALCATLVFLFTRRPPFDGTTLIERVQAVMQGATDANNIAPVIRAGLAPDPDARPSIDAILASI